MFSCYVIHLLLVPRDEYLRSGLSSGEVVPTERALDGCIALLSQRDSPLSLERFAETCAPSLAHAGERMEAAIASSVGENTVSYLIYWVSCI